MESVGSIICYWIIALAIVIFSVLTVTTRKILRAATYLLFALFATAGLYFKLDYEFLGTVQIAVYAGGIVVLFVFSILLTTRPGDNSAQLTSGKQILGFLGAAAAACGAGWALLSRCADMSAALPAMANPDMRQIGVAMLGTGYEQYLLPFEAVSILLLACIIGGVVIARKRLNRKKDMEITMIYYLVPALVMFCCGVYGFLTRRNMIAMLISLELMLNAVDINFVVFNRYLYPGSMDGWMFTLFGIAIAAAETALAIAIIINLFRVSKNIDVRDTTQMKH